MKYLDQKYNDYEGEQMSRLFSNILLFVTMNICPIASNISQKGSKFCQIPTELILQ